MMLPDIRIDAVIEWKSVKDAVYSLPDQYFGDLAKWQDT